MTPTEYVAAKRSLSKVKLTVDTSGNPVCRIDSVVVQVLPKDQIAQLDAAAAVLKTTYDKATADIAEFRTDLQAIPNL